MKKILNWIKAILCSVLFFVAIGIMIFILVNYPLVVTIVGLVGLFISIAFMIRMTWFNRDLTNVVADSLDS